MPLASGKSSLQSVLESLYSDVGALKSVPEFAKKKAQAVHDFAITGMPMTLITTFPGSVSGAMTSGPVKGIGIGGIDKPTPGMGLDAAKALFEQELIGIRRHGNKAHAVPEIAQKEAAAFFNYFSQAIVMTKDETSSPLPAPPPVGPVAGSISAKGGIGKDSPGSGYDSARSKLEDALTSIWSQVKEAKSLEELTRQEVEAYHAFFIEGKIETKGTFIAPAVVAPPPAPPMGAYLPGAGTSVSGKLT
jgi:hypothetical protein